MFKKIFFTGIMGLLFISSSFAGDLAGFTAKVNPSNVKVGQAVDLDIKAVDNDGNVVQDYQGDILIVVKDGDNELSPDDYSESNDGTYSFTEHDMGKKKFTKLLTINKKGCFKVHVEDFDTSNGGDAYIGVGQKCDITLLSGSKKIKLSSSKNTKQVIHSKIIINEKYFKISNEEYNEINKLISEGNLKSAIKKLINIYSKATVNPEERISYITSLYKLSNNLYSYSRNSILEDINFFSYSNDNNEEKLLKHLIKAVKLLPILYDYNDKIDSYILKNETKITLLPKYKKVLTKLGLGKVVKKLDNFTNNFFNKYKTQETINSKLSELFAKIEIARYKIENSNLNKKKKILVKGILSYLKLSLIKGYIENKKNFTENTEGFAHQQVSSIGVVGSDIYSLPNYFKNQLTEQETDKVNKDMITFQKYIGKNLKQNIEKYNKLYLSNLKNQFSKSSKKVGKLTSTLNFISNKLGNINSKLNISNYSISKTGNKAKINGNIDFNIKGGVKNPFGGEATNIDVSASTFLDSIFLQKNMYLNIQNLKYTGIKSSFLSNLEPILEKIKKVNSKYIKIPIENNNSSYKIFNNFDIKLLYDEIDSVVSHKLFVPYKKDGNKYYIYPTKYTCDYLKMLDNINYYGFNSLYSHNLNTCTNDEYNGLLNLLKNSGNIYFEKDYNSYKIGFESNNKDKVKFEALFNKNYSDISLDKINLNIYEDKNHKLNLSYEKGNKLNYKFFNGDLNISVNTILNSNNLPTHIDASITGNSYNDTMDLNILVNTTFNSNNLPTYIDASISGNLYSKDTIDGKLKLQNHNISGNFKYNSSNSYKQQTKVVNINGKTTYDNKIDNLNINFSEKNKYDEESFAYNYGNNAYSGSIKYATNNIEISYNENDNYGGILFNLKLNNGKIDGKFNVYQGKEKYLNISYNGNYRKDYFSLNTNIKQNGLNLGFYKKCNININLLSSKNNSSIKVDGKLGDNDKINFNLNDSFNTYLSNMQDIKAPSNYIDIYNLRSSIFSDTTRKANLSTISTALQMYYNDNGEYPGKDFELHKVSFLKDYLVPTYISELPNDPTEGKTYYYMSLPRYGGTNAGSVIISEMEGNIGNIGNISANSIEDLAKEFKTLGDASIIEKKLGKCKETDKKCFYVIFN